MPGAPADPLPLTRAQIRALVRAATRQLVHGQRAASREADIWRARAARIADPVLRHDAITALNTKRGHTDGAALFCVLTQRSAQLLRILVAYELIWDYLDSVHERAPDETNGRQLHLALVDALDPDRPTADYYRHHPHRDDGGYLDELVATCRALCRVLPNYPLVRRLLQQEAWKAQVLALNHILDPAQRDARLREWVASDTAPEPELLWFEICGAASASLVVHALLAIAADPNATADDVDRTYHAYWPWISLATTMLDSYVDQADDAANTHHSYVAHYANRDEMLGRIAMSIQRSARGALQLRDGERHAVVVSSMIAMYLSKDSVRTPSMRATSDALVRVGGSLTRLLLPILRLWRIRYSQRSA